MAAWSGELARRTGDQVEIHARPLRLRWTLSDLATADGHRLNCTFTCSVVAVDRAADRQMLAETFLASRDAVGAGDVVAHFLPAFASAATQLVSTKPADGWLNDSAESAMAEALRAAARPIAFASGIELLPPFEVQLASPSVERLRIEAMERQLAERRSAGQVEHFQRAAELLRSFDALRAASPGVSVGRVLEAVSPGDQGAMLQTLLAASGRAEGQSLWAVGGMGLAGIESNGAIATFDLPADVGSPRSLRHGELDGRAVWLIGCRLGVLIVDASDQRVVVTLYDRALHTIHGFGGAVLRDGEVTACHSEGGIVRWRIDQPDKPVYVWRPVSGEQPRNLCELDPSRLAYSSFDQLITLKGDQGGSWPFESAEPIVALLVHDQDLFVIRADGEVIRKDTSRPLFETRSRSRYCGPVGGAVLLPWAGGVRLLLATQDGPVCCVGTDDSVVTQYVSAHRGLKALAATNGLIAGVSGDRQRVVLWNSWDGRKPAAEVNVAAKTRHRIADVAFAPTPQMS
ncbi:MAG: hypothetical protein WBD40_18135 [Tepidisphaeraceae bacterium]